MMWVASRWFMPG
jgi:hypothetical protein